MTDVWVMLRDAARAKLLSLADAYSGFSHLEMGKTARELTVINTVMGLIEWVTMPQGPINGPTEFQQAMNSTFQDLISEGVMKFYIDDGNLRSGEYEEGGCLTDEDYEIHLGSSLLLRGVVVCHTRNYRLWQHGKRAFR